MHPPDQSEDNAGARVGRFWSRLRAFEFRDAWWLLLDLWESRRLLRVSLYALGLAVILGTVTTVWVYPWWRQRTAVDMARQWLEAGKLDRASESVQEALKVAPDNPESWKLAADLARRLGNKTNALSYSAKAAELAPRRQDLILIWAADTLLANQIDATAVALAKIPPGALAQSGPAQRMLGELARRRQDLPAAFTHFENALRIEGPGTAINEVPLGIVLLPSNDAGYRQRGLDLLTKWTPDPDWGAQSSRALLQDALIRNDHPAMRRWAETLRQHPRCTLGDIPNCLLALAKTDEPRFHEVLAVMEKNHAGDPANAALLISWLNQIGRSEEALRWIQSLPTSLTTRAPAAAGVAESMRLTQKWPELLDWAGKTSWGRDLEPIQLIYQLLAARKTNQSPLARDLWATLQSRATTDGGRTLFTADTLYSWGLHAESIELLWAGANLAEIAAPALGTLARHYQVSRDADGQYQVFKRLRALRPADADIANNYAYFAALTGHDLRPTEEIAHRNFQQTPGNLAYRSTYALVLCTQNRANEALALLLPVSENWQNKPAMILAYGLALAGTDQKDAAQTVLASLRADTLTTPETVLISQALK